MKHAQRHNLLEQSSSRAFARLLLLMLCGLVALTVACSRNSENNTSNNTTASNNTSNNTTSAEVDDESCSLGEEGCACMQGSVCGQDDDGVQLACILGVCSQAPCEAGQAGCACNEGACEAGLECSSASGVERCEVSGCETGALDCTCRLDRSCDGSGFCSQGVCQVLDCQVGDEGCGCSKWYTCGANLSCDLSSDTCVDPDACAPGSENCACDASGDCDAGLLCESGTCRDPDCSPGLRGCACAEGDVPCGKDSSGEQMVCSEGVCEQMACPSGQTGCACRLGIDCDEEGASCVNGYCKQDNCIPGTVDCECLAGSCDPGLDCVGGSICVDSQGLTGGDCYENGTCSYGNRCDKSINPSVCVKCDPGSIGCACSTDTSGATGDGCNPGLACVMDICVGDETVAGRTPPDDGKCYTYCNNNLIDSNSSRLCVDNYMEGCLDGQICDKGSCVADNGGAADICATDSACPEHQICMQGYCYSECDTNEECSDGLFCHKKVCRQACVFGEGDCPSNMECDSSDASSGYCVAKAQPSGEQYVPATGGASLSKTVFEFNNTAFSDTFVITNDSDSYVNFTIRKVEHEVSIDASNTDKVTDYDPDSMCSGANCPLWFLEMGEFGSISQDREIDVRAPPKCDPEVDCPVVSIRLANNGQAIDAARWRGVIEVSSDVGSERLDISYVSTPQGRWAGKMYYFANFETQGIDTDGQNIGWIARSDRSIVNGVSNGLIQRWGAFRTNNLSSGWGEMKAVLTSTQTGQWQQAAVQEDCIASAGACYLFDSGAGALPNVYVNSLAAAPIPTGVVEFPIAMNLYNPPNASGDAFAGRIVSEAALHYAGSPAISLTFDGDPTDTANCDTKITSNCFNAIQDLDVDINVGGRYALGEGSSSCGQDYALVETPWLIPGFLENVSNNNGVFYKRECVDNRLPFYNTMKPEEVITNRNLARSNPIPNGAVLERTIELLDGGMIDQSEMFILFRERYPSFLGDGEDLVAYGYMLMRRMPVEISDVDDDGDLIPDEYAGSMPPQGLPAGGVGARAVCSRDLLDEVLGTNAALTAQNAPEVIRALIDGGEPAPSAELDIPTQGGTEEVHYVCEDTGLFDGGPDNIERWGSGSIGPNNNSCATSLNGVCEDGLSSSTASTCAQGTDLADCGWRYSDARVSCPVRSRVVYFTTNTSLVPDIAGLPCQQDGTCMDTLNQWITNGSPQLIQLEPKWRCADGGSACDVNPLDRRHGKIFYKANTQDVLFLSLRNEIAEAFRYKTRFLARDGTAVGFTPELCVPYSTTTPYCYDPEAIEALRERVDCLLDVYDRYYDVVGGIDTPESQKLYNYLDENFALRYETDDLNVTRSYDGFERLYAELLIMLGDDAYTSAFESRFDLAGSLAASFEGESFEANGINLSGIAGFEMFKLYQAVQYYDMVLDRFYAQGEVIGASLGAGDPGTAVNFISAETVTSYFDRLIRASTQRSRALAEIARRYQNFNRPDLARRVAERAYTATYLESVILANLIVRFYEIAGGSNRPQILAALEQSQLRYRMALLDLVNVYSTLTKEINIFGYSPDYIPFPALDSTSAQSAESNAFEKVLRTSLSKMSVAQAREQSALNATRSYETDSASFQAELTRLSQTYENQLAEVCGTFQGSDGLIYPAIERYAYLDERLSIIGDPCGFAGNGGIHRAFGELDQRRLEMRQISTQAQNIYERIEIERQRVSDQCGVIVDIADYNYKIGRQNFRLQEDMLRTQSIIDAGMRSMETVTKGIEIVQCDGAECAAVGPALATLAAAHAATEAAIATGQVLSAKRREERSKIDLDSAEWNTLQQCEMAKIDSNATTASMLLELRDLEISALAAQYRLNLSLSEIERLRHQATRIQMEWEENTELVINVEAAKNDPNIRIYRNDSVLNAEIAFEDALREAYRLTVVYEYYTSQSYAQRDQLFLIRMVSAGDYNLENYIYELANAFTTFEEEYGLPDQRVLVVSLRDDILQIPHNDPDREAIGKDERIAMLQDLVTDPSMLNSDGYLVIPFSTNLESLSPLTANHKVLYIEANIEGGGTADALGRLYIRQVGTSVIRTVEDEFAYYRFPERTAVVNTFFNGSRQFSNTPEIYRNFRLRDRPLVNTEWEIVLNQRDELVNQDINLKELTDIKLYIYYNDFTVY